MTSRRSRRHVVSVVPVFADESAAELGNLLQLFEDKPNKEPAWDIDFFSMHLTKLVVTIFTPGATLHWAVDDTRVSAH